MPVLVTAFGPFGGRIQNASSLALLELRRSSPGIRTRILPVDAVLAPSRLKQAILRIRPTALIMLGEAAGSTMIRLETTAWNEMDFAIPDVAGRKPVGMPIRQGAAGSIPSTLPLAEIYARLVSLGHVASCCDDPGRYVCNHLFFSALDFLNSHSMGIPAGFIHLPLESVLPTAVSASVIAEIIGFVGGDETSSTH